MDTETAVNAEGSVSDLRPDIASVDIAKAPVDVETAENAESTVDDIAAMDAEAQKTEYNPDAMDAEGCFGYSLGGSNTFKSGTSLLLGLPSSIKPPNNFKITQKCTAIKKTTMLAVRQEL